MLMTNSVTGTAKVFLNTLIFLLQKSEQKLPTFFSAKSINVFALYQDGNFNVTFANNFVKF